MLTKTLELPLSGTISDAVLLGKRVFAALNSGLVVIEHGTPAATFDIPVQSLVTSDDSSTILAVSPILERDPHTPFRRRVHSVTAPFVAPEDLGIAPIEGFCDSFDGRDWPTYEGDDVSLFSCRSTGLELRAKYASSWPVDIERIPEGIWLVISSLGARHFEILSVPDLRPIKNGDLRLLHIEFPPELALYSKWAPTLAQPIIAVHGNALPLPLDEHGTTREHPVKNANRLMNPDGTVITTLEAPAEGLVASGKRALSWFPTKGGMEFVLVCLATVQVQCRFILEGATKAGARIMGRDILVWERETLHVFHDGA